MIYHQMASRVRSAKAADGSLMAWAGAIPISEFAMAAGTQMGTKAHDLRLAQ